MIFGHAICKGRVSRLMSPGKIFECAAVAFAEERSGQRDLVCLVI